MKVEVTAVPPPSVRTAPVALLLVTLLAPDSQALMKNGAFGSVTLAPARSGVCPTAGVASTAANAHATATRRVLRRVFARWQGAAPVTPKSPAVVEDSRRYIYPGQHESRGRRVRRSGCPARTPVRLQLPASRQAFLAPRRFLLQRRRADDGWIAGAATAPSPSATKRR